MFVNSGTTTLWLIFLILVCNQFWNLYGVMLNIWTIFSENKSRNLFCGFPWIEKFYFIYIHQLLFVFYRIKFYI